VRKVIAIINVIAWSGFWAFGYLALTAQDLSDRQIVIAAVLAGGGFLTGIIAYLKLSVPPGGTPNKAARHADTTQEG
jgi:hypothetical protein